MRTLICLVSALLSSTVVAQDHRLTAARLDGDVLHLQATNGLQVVRHFQLPNPPRVVLDLFGLDGSLAEMPVLPSTSPAVEVRTGEHPEFLRVVVDLKEALPTYQVRQQDNSIKVGLGSGALPPSSLGVMIEGAPDPGTPAAPRSRPAPVVAVGVEASPGDQAVAPAATQQSATTPSATAATANGAESFDDLSTDELLALIEAELEAAGLDQEQSAEELIEQVEAELGANNRRPATSSPPPAREPPSAAERRLRRTPRRVQPPPPADGEERPPFQFVDEETAETPPAADDGDDGDDGDDDN